jgi:hypothetical protein
MEALFAFLCSILLFFVSHQSSRSHAIAIALGEKLIDF